MCLKISESQEKRNHKKRNFGIGGIVITVILGIILIVVTPIINDHNPLYPETETLPTVIVGNTIVSEKHGYTVEAPNSNWLLVVDEEILGSFGVSDMFRTDIRGELSSAMFLGENNELKKSVEIFVQNANKYSYDVYISEIEKDVLARVDNNSNMVTHVKNDLGDFFHYAVMTCDNVNQNICDVYTGSDYVKKSDNKIYTFNFLSLSQYDKDEPPGYVSDDSSGTRFGNSTI